LTNQSGGTVTIGAPDTRQDDSTLTTNSGTFTVSSTGHYGITNGGFTDASGATLALDRHHDRERRHLHPVGRDRVGQPVVNSASVTLADSAGTGVLRHSRQRRQPESGTIPDRARR
jgi:hypothetical protein